MSEIDDKRLVAEWMLRELVEDSPYAYLKDNNIYHFDDWNPQSDERATFKEWDEIHDKMTDEEGYIYCGALWEILECEQEKTKNSLATQMQYLSAKPSVLWIALLAMMRAKDV